jgi:CheY-like chemotaxis protein
MSESLQRPDESALPAFAEPRRKRVLIVDDDHASRIVCANYCDLFDHASEAVRSGAEAVCALRLQAFDVVVLNLHMAAAGGLDLLRAFRALPGEAARVPVVGVAGVGKAHEAQRWLAAGVTAVVAKPVSASRFFAALSSVDGAAGDNLRSWAPAP